LFLADIPDATATGAAYAMATGTDGIVRKVTWESIKPFVADNLGNHTAIRNLNINDFSIVNTQRLLFNNTGVISAKNSQGTEETVFWPRFSDGATYLNYGIGGFNIRNNASTVSMFMSNAGNIGIGTAAPVARLDVASAVNNNTYGAKISASNYGGTSAQQGALLLENVNSHWGATLTLNNTYLPNGPEVLFKNTDTTVGSIDYDGSGTSYIGTDYVKLSSNKYAAINTGGAERVRVLENGNVGIGTTTPFGKLQVNGATATNGLVVSSGAAWDALTLGHDGSTAYINASGAESGLVFRTNASGSGDAITGTYSEKMRILNNGNVGIGTGSPEFKLHVSDRMKMDGADAGTWIEAGSTDWFLGREGTNLRFWNDGDNRFNLTTAGNMSNSGTHTIGNVPNVGGSTYAMVTETDGTVRKQTWESIKTSVADNLGNHSAITELQMNTKGIENANYIRFKYNNDGSSEGYIGYNNNNISYVAENGSNHYFTGGNVGINREPSTTALHVKQAYYTTSPELTLENDVSVKRSFKVNPNGSLVFRDDSNNNTHRFDTNGDAYKIGSGTSWNILSDERIKENVKDFKDGLDVLLKIRPVTYKYISAKYGDVNKLNIGVLAQEIEKVAPYTVNKVPGDQKIVEDDFKDLRTYNPESLLYVLINSIKEQQLIIDQLKIQVSDLLKKKE
jgi:hypothetical protein